MSNETVLFPADPPVEILTQYIADPSVEVLTIQLPGIKGDKGEPGIKGDPGNGDEILDLSLAFEGGLI